MVDKSLCASGNYKGRLNKEETVVDKVRKLTIRGGSWLVGWKCSRDRDGDTGCGSPIFPA